MMSRASRVLKWVGAGTVLLAAAPIAYAESPAPNPEPNPPQHSSHSCGDERPDLGVQRLPGSRLTEGGVITWDAGGLTYFPQPGYVSPDRSACAGVPSPGAVTGSGTATPDDSDTVTLQRR
jgi:hypothetical protein